MCLHNFGEDTGQYTGQGRSGVKYSAQVAHALCEHIRASPETEKYYALEKRDIFICRLPIVHVRVSRSKEKH